VESVLRQVFPDAYAYRYNSASIRVRITDRRFQGLATPERVAMVEPLLELLPEPTQADIMNLLTLYPGEIDDSLTKLLANTEFDDPSPAEL
jgi:hypothetical protein